MFGFHFGTQPSITQEHLPSPTGRMISLKWLLWVTLADPGCKNRRIENPRVGGSIPPPSPPSNQLPALCVVPMTQSLSTRPVRAAARLQHAAKYEMLQPWGDHSAWVGRRSNSRAHSA